MMVISEVPAHTPEPWSVEVAGGRLWVSGADRIICVSAPGVDPNDPTMLADFHMMAGAPAALKLLRRMLKSTLSDINETKDAELPQVLLALQFLAAELDTVIGAMEGRDRSPPPC